MMDFLAALIDWFIERLSQLKRLVVELPDDRMAALPTEPAIIQMMTYDVAVSYFVTKRPDDQAVKKGAMLKNGHPQGYVLSQFFLDQSNQPVCRSNGKLWGRKIIAREFDQDLTEAFGDKSLIIVE